MGGTRISASMLPLTPELLASRSNTCNRPSHYLIKLNPSAPLSEWEPGSAGVDELTYKYVFTGALYFQRMPERKW
jgi:hypothetical protein